MAKATKPALTEEELAALAAEQAAAEQAAADMAASEGAPTEDIPVVEEAPAQWQGNTTRAYRSFAVPFGGVIAGEQVEQAEQVNAPADGQQEEPQV